MHGSVSVDCRGVCRRNGRLRSGRRSLLAADDGEAESCDSHQNLMARFHSILLGSVRAVERSGQSGIAVVLEHVIYLRFDDASQGDWRQIPFREKIDTAGFDAFGGGSSADFAEEEKFVDVVLDPRMVVFVAIVDRGQFFQTTSK